MVMAKRRETFLLSVSTLVTYGQQPLRPQQRTSEASQSFQKQSQTWNLKLSPIGKQSFMPNMSTPPRTEISTLTLIEFLAKVQRLRSLMDPESMNSPSKL